MSRSRLMFPGGFVPVASIGSTTDAVDLWCAFCWRSVGDGLLAGWLHVGSNRVVCVKCLPDPWKKNGQAGERMAEKVAAVKDPEYEVDVW